MFSLTSGYSCYSASMFSLTSGYSCYSCRAFFRRKIQSGKFHKLCRYKQYITQKYKTQKTCYIYIYCVYIYLLSSRGGRCNVSEWRRRNCVPCRSDHALTSPDPSDRPDLTDVIILKHLFSLVKLTRMNSMNRMIIWNDLINRNSRQLESQINLNRLVNRSCLINLHCLVNRNCLINLSCLVNRNCLINLNCLVNRKSLINLNCLVNRKV